MKFVGAHVSAGGGVENAPLQAAAIGAKAFSFFTRNQRQWVAKPLTDESIREFRENCMTNGYTPDHILPHGSYLINAGASNSEILTKSRLAMVDEMQRAELLGLKMYNFHPGSHGAVITEDDSLKITAESINYALSQTRGVAAVIENTAGQGSATGYVFEHMRRIIDLVEDKQRVGVCIDTAHAFASGFNISTPEGYEQMMTQFEEIVGRAFLRGMHLNDSKKAAGSRVDRHETIGNGLLGLETFRYIMNDSRLNGLPLILETPEPEKWAEEIRLLYSLAAM